MKFYLEIDKKPDNCPKCRYMDGAGDCPFLKNSGDYKTFEEQYDHCPIVEEKLYRRGNMPLDSVKEVKYATTDGTTITEYTLDKVELKEHGHKKTKITIEMADDVDYISIDGITINRKENG